MAYMMFDHAYLYLSRKPLVGYVLALLLCGIAFLVRLAMGPVEMGLQYVTFFPVITITSVVGGYRAGLFSTLIGMIFATFVFTSPYYSVSWLAFHHALWPNLVFLCDGILVCGAVELLHRYRQKSIQDLEVFRGDLAQVLENTRYLKTIIDNLFTYASLLDLDGKVLEVNKAPLDRAGLKREQVVGAYFQDAPWWTYDPVVRNQLIQAMEQAVQGEVVRYNVNVWMAGDIIPIDFQIAPVRDDSGVVVGLLPTAVDISKRHRAEMLSQRYQMMVNQSHDAFLVLNDIGIIVDANMALTRMSGYTHDELVGMHISKMNADEDPDLVPQHMARIKEIGHDLFETRQINKDGSLTAVEVSVTYMPETRQLFSMVRDISERKRIEEDRRIAAATFETHEAIVVTDVGGTILRVNKAFERITGFSADEVLGQTPRILKSGRHDEAFYHDMWQGLLTNGMWEGEVWDRRKSGQIYPKWATITALTDDSGKTTEYVSIFSDITHRKQAEEEIRNLAFYDALTSLPNRRLLLDRFQMALLASERMGQAGAVLFLDMDRFKVLNDTLGHESGDRMLVEVADRIRFSVRDVDTVARLGGDEFVVLLENLGSTIAEATQRVVLVAEKIRGALVSPYHIHDHVHHSSPSIGVCLFQGTSVPVDTLLKHADTAMYQAKNAGRNTVRFFDPLLQHQAELRAKLEQELQQAVGGGQLRLYYQVQFDDFGHATGAEALVRWQHPTLGLVAPAQFIPIAEESSLILDIGNWVLNTACRQLADWSRNPQTRSLVLAVNVSAKQFRAADFAAYVQRLVRQYNIKPSLLKLELTESVILDDVNDVIQKMHELKAIGIMLSLDDFGTGYSSLSYLKRLPLDQIKIDRSFVHDVVTDNSDALMVQAIIDMARNFSLNVIAEGVENREQLAFLKENGCQAYQGYLFSEPVPVELFELLLQQNDALQPQST